MKFVMSFANLRLENDFYPQFEQDHVTVRVSASLRRGDTVALLEANDADLTYTCQADDCPCARQAFAIESGNADGLFAICLLYTSDAADE